MPKVKDLDKEKLKGAKLKSPRGVIGYFASAGKCIVFLSKTKDTFMPEEGKKDETRMYPQVIGKNEDLLEWDVIEDERILVNCADLTSHKYTMNIDVDDSHD